MNFHDEIKKMQQQQITIKLQVTDHGSQVLRGIARQCRLGQALEKSFAEHYLRVICGFDPRLN